MQLTLNISLHSNLGSLEQVTQWFSLTAFALQSRSKKLPLHCFHHHAAVCVRTIPRRDTTYTVDRSSAFAAEECLQDWLNECISILLNENLDVILHGMPCAEHNYHPLHGGAILVLDIVEMFNYCQVAADDNMLVLLLLNEQSLQIEDCS